MKPAAPLQAPLALAAAFLLLLSTGAAQRGFWGKHGEARRAEVAREVASSGSWTVPTLLEDPFITKPPLAYWSMAAVFRLTGKVSEGMARVPAVLAALGTLILVMAMSARAAPAAGRAMSMSLAAGAAFASMPLVILMGQNAETEPLLLFFTALTVYSYLRIAPGRPFGTTLPWRVMMSLALALGFMVKGPLGWIFPLAGVASCELTAGSGGRRLKPADLILFSAAHLVIVLPWVAAVLNSVPDAVTVWTGETVSRFGDTAFDIHREPFWYYLPSIGAFGAVAVFLPLALPSLFRRGGFSRNWPLLWFLSGVIFLSLATSKRAHYMLSLAPALALAVAFWVGEDGRRAEGRLFGALLRGASFLLPVILLAPLLPAVSLGTPGVLAAAGGSIVLALLWKKRRVEPLYLLGTSTLAVFFVFSATVLPAIDRYRSPADFYAEVGEAIAGSDRTVVNWNNDRYSSSFYLGRTVRNAFGETDLLAIAPGGAWLVGQEGDFDSRPPDSREILRVSFHDPFKPLKKKTFLLYVWDPGSAPARGGG